MNDSKKVQGDTLERQQKISRANRSIANSLDTTKNVAVATKINNKQFLLDFVKGEFSDSEAWFIKTETDTEFVVLPGNVLDGLLSTIKVNHEEKIFIGLRHELKELMPIDLDDVMAVGLSELERYRGKDGNLPVVNVKQVAKKIKRNYPNLFVNLPNVFL